MNRSILILTVCLLSFARCFGQGTLHFTFDEPPMLPGTARIVPEYSEVGMWFRSLNFPEPGSGFVRRGPSSLDTPENGTTYLQAGGGNSLVFSLFSGEPFSLLSVDLAEYSTLFPTSLEVPFVGYRPDGSSVSTVLTTDGIIDGTGPIADFQTFYFGPEFSGVTRVEIPTYGWSLDNLVVAVPEPSSALLLLAGGGVFWLVRRASLKL